MKSLTLQSPAKLNLYLKVLNKRKDGYHTLSTVFERINLFDDITFKLTRDKVIRVRCSHPHVPTGPKNLVYKVAKLLREQFALENGVEIKITKRIPVAAGLAGGSSNAATTILGLNQLWKLALTQAEMVKIAQKIGADVPFFLYDSSWAHGTERGDRIKTLKIDTKLWHILVVPKVKMYSRKVFEAFNLQLTKPGDNANILIHYLRSNNINNVGDLLLNDLEISSFRLCSKLSKLKDQLLNLGVVGAALSGSGPSVFGLVGSKKEAQDLQKVLSKRYSQVFVVQTF